jgi:hypothetical protein
MVYGLSYFRNREFSFINFGGNTKNVCTLWNGRILISKKKGTKIGSWFPVSIN